MALALNSIYYFRSEVCMNITVNFRDEVDYTDLRFTKQGRYVQGNRV